MEHAICESIYVQVLTNLHLSCFVLSKALRWGRNQNVGTTLAAASGGTLILVMPSTLGLTYHISHHLGVCTVYILAKFWTHCIWSKQKEGGVAPHWGASWDLNLVLPMTFNNSKIVGVFRTFAPIMRLKGYILLFSFQTSRL